MGDNVSEFTRIAGRRHVHTHLKGRIFTTQGTSYLVLSEDGAQPDTLQVKALNAGRKVSQMRCDEIQRHLAQKGAAAGK